MNVHDYILIFDPIGTVETFGEAVQSSLFWVLGSSPIIPPWGFVLDDVGGVTGEVGGTAGGACPTGLLGGSRTTTFSITKFFSLEPSTDSDDSVDGSKTESA